MARSLAPIPQGQPITDQSGVISDFFRLRWQQLIDGFTQTPTADSVSETGKTAALVTTQIYTTTVSGPVRLAYYIRKTVADGVASTLTVTFGWVESGIAQSVTFAVLATDTILAVQTAEALVQADANTDVTIAIAYTSTTPNKMTYRYLATAERLVL